MDKPITSEEKLLRLIRKKPSEAGGFSKSGSQRSGSGKQQIQQSSRLFKNAIALLMVIIFGIIGYFGVLQFLGEEEVGVVISEEEKVVVDQVETKALSIPKAKPFSYYQAKLEQRDLFESPWEKPQDEQPVSVENKSVVEFSKHLKVVGIVLDDSPQVIIEDTKSKETFFLIKGDHISGAVVEEIQESKVILSYQGKKIELVP